MAALVSLLTLRTEARRRANMENSTVFAPDAEVTAYINATLRRLYNAIIEADATQYYATVTFTTIDGQASYAIGTIVPAGNFYKLRSVDIANGSTKVNGVKYTEDERNLYTQYPYAAGWPVRYRLEGANFILAPVPSAGYVVTVNYYPALTALVQDFDIFDGVSGWEEYAIWKTVAYLLAKEESDASFANGMADELMSDIRQMAATRDHSEPDRAVNVYTRRYGGRR